MNGSAITTVTVTSADDNIRSRCFDSSHKSDMLKYMRKMSNRIMTLFVEVTPRDYKINKMHMEAKKGAYDMKRALAVLRRKNLVIRLGGTVLNNKKVNNNNEPVTE